MKEEPHNPWSDPELEARIVALVLGEASDFECDELNRLIEQRPELAAFKDQIQRTHGLLRDVQTGELLTDDDDWKLPADKRSAVLAVIGGDAEKQSANQSLSKLADDRRSAKRNSFRTLFRIAAVVCFVVLPGSMAILTLFTNRSFDSARSRQLASNTTYSRDSKVASETFGGDGSAPSRDSYRVDVAGITAADEGYFQTVEPATVTEVDSRKNSKSALGAIRDSLNVDAIAATPNDDQVPSVTIGLDPQGLPAADLDLRFETGTFGEQPAFDGFDAGAASTQGVNGPESSLPQAAGYPALSDKEEAERSDDVDGDGNGELSFPKFAGRSDELNALDPAEPVRSTISVPDGGTVLLGGVKRFAEGRSEPGVSGESNLSSPMSHEYAESESGAEAQDAVGERDGGLGFDDRSASDRKSMHFGFERGEDQQLWVDAPDAAEGNNTDRSIADGEGMGGMGGGSGGAGLGIDDGLRNDTSAEHEPQEEVGSGVWRDTREFSVTAPSQPVAAGKGDRPETTDAGAYYDAEIPAKPRLANSMSEPVLGTATAQPRGGREAEQAKQSFEIGKRVKSSLGEISAHTELYRNADTAQGLRSDDYDKDVDQVGTLRRRGKSAMTGATRYWYVPPMLEDNSESTKNAQVKKTPAPAGLNEKTAEGEPFSTFSLHVSDVSFKLARAALAQGEWPDAAKVRIEEFVNAFDYGDPMPSQSERVACNLEQSIHPFLQQRNLLRVSMRTAAAGRSSSTPLRLTLLLDNSGSMERIDRQQIVRRAFALLAQQLKPIDQVTLISFARQPRLLADKVSGAQSHQLVQLTHSLPSQGGTNIEAALQLAFEKAQEQQLDGAQNRIILLTDGAVNLGNADPESLSRMITTMRNAGIAFDAAGISAEGLNDEILEALTRKGDGRYYLLDSLEAADDGFARQIAGALRPSAKNVKVQIEFNPKRVGRYKLLGFEKHRLKQEDFRDDNVDAAEMAAAEAGVALYQFEAKPDGEGDVGSVSVRFRDLSTGRMIENRWPIPYEADAPRPDQAGPSLRIATSAALLAARLRGEALGATVDLKTLSDLIAGLPDLDRNASRVQQLHLMIQQARQMSGK